MDTMWARETIKGHSFTFLIPGVDTHTVIGLSVSQDECE